MAFNESNREDKQKRQKLKFTREFGKGGRLKRILIEDPMGKRKNSFDSSGKICERCMEYKNGNWKQILYKNGTRYVRREIDGISITTMVFDANGKLRAVTEE